MGRLDGKVCVITGAGGGIGRACSLRFAAEGGRVACADVLEEPGRETVALVEAAGGEAAFFAADVTDEPSVAALYDAVEDRFGAVHVLVNNAGVLLPGDGSVLETDLETWHRVLGINLTGVFLCCKHGIPKLLAAGGGSVVNMGSISGLVGSATAQIGYAASKGGVIALTRDVAVELARRGVRANALCPGPVETPLALQLFQDEAAWERRRVHIPAGRLGKPAEIAEAALFLASDESSWVTGSSLVVDGGIAVAYTTPE
ncbi:MAG: glucose 1-dehydrogenase [Thermoleophilia bacterium]|nr:glucose 1-dehydrogenase [Thermoleophilia bacterium]